MDLTFQVPMQYCSLQHWTLLPSAVTSTSGHCFCFGSVSLAFLELLLHWSTTAYWAPIDLGSSSLSIISFCLFILFFGFSRQEYWSSLPFPCPLDHVLSELSTMTHLSWVALHGMVHSFTELDKAVILVISLISFLWLWFSSYLPSDKDNSLMEAQCPRPCNRPQLTHASAGDSWTLTGKSGSANLGKINASQLLITEI